MPNISDYQKEQLDALIQIRRILAAESDAFKADLKRLSAAYIAFREEVDEFLAEHFSDHCTRKCFMQRQSLCCSKEGIITFFADVVINAINASEDELNQLAQILTRPNKGYKCVYLGESGCLWQTKPIGCAMFLCDPAKEAVFSRNPEAKQAWQRFRDQAKRFKWPDRPVLFDLLEEQYLALGCRSSLMYLHNSPGLLKLKEKWGK